MPASTLRTARLRRQNRSRTRALRLVAMMVACCVVSAALAAPTAPVAGSTQRAATRAAPAAPTPAAASGLADEGLGFAWCAPELRAVTAEVCFGDPRETAAPSQTLVIFLHSLLGADQGSAWQQQRHMSQLAKAYGFALLIPHGRRGLGPGRAANVIAWPTAPELRERYEHALLAEIAAARAALNAAGHSFTRTLVFGFSNGAYYATSLAFRERLDADGVAVFAGGSGSKLHNLQASRAKKRIPLFVAYGSKDPDHPQQEALVRLLQQLKWPHSQLASRVGHTVADAQVRAALRYLGHLLPTE